MSKHLRSSRFSGALRPCCEPVYNAKPRMRQHDSPGPEPEGLQLGVRPLVAKSIPPGPHLRRQRRLPLPLPPRPPRQAITRLDPHPAPARCTTSGSPLGQAVHPRPEGIPDLTGAGQKPGGVWEAVQLKGGPLLA
jgi:hypothetical protein